MNYNTIYVGMDIHKESFTLCAYTIDAILTTLVPVNRFKSQGLFLDRNVPHSDNHRLRYDRGRLHADSNGILIDSIAPFGWPPRNRGGHFRLR